MSSEEDLDLWQQTLARIKQEVTELPAEERAWIESHLAAAAGLQEKMHGVFLAAGGEAVCADCQGLCCDRAKYHPTLVNLLHFLMPGDKPPVADFTRSCPFLGPAGCPFPAARRPFNCLTFLCERVEERLSPAECEEFYAFERQLREVYLAFDRRYTGSSLRGLLNRAAGLGGRPFLDRL